MLSKMIHFIKPVIITVVLIGLLQVTGIWGNASATAQMLVLKTGVLNADAEAKKNPEAFDYNFSLKDLSGKNFSFNEYKDQVLFINLWATWCGPCKAEMPGIQKLSDKMKDHPVNFIMLSIDKETALPKVKSYLENNQFTFPVFLPNGNLPELLRVPSIPTTFVVSKDGKILMKEVGTRNYDTNKMINFLIEQTKK